MINKNKTVVKSLDLLNLFLTNEELSLNEMVQLSGIPKTSIHRMIGSLEEMGFLHKDAEGKYSLGLLFLQFGQLVAERLDIRQVARPVMQALRDEFEEAVNLVIKDRNECIYIEKLESTHPVRLYTKIGRRAPLYAGACARIILSFLPEQEREQYLQTINPVPFALGTVTDKQKLRQMLEESRINGYSISHSELEDHTASLAAPIFDYSGKVVGGLSIAGPDIRFQEDRLPELIERVKSSATDISRKLGWTDKALV
ncbi:MULTISPECIES: IclR family transcriptional regulator [unclassified Paenibacillus]|uniref:IclR family transcriptional regulator n=1 Tax=unclassified Paenibacillus TaxID=185978 RepID=UPI0024070CCB|nr:MULTISPECIES: IclR family transcriptional regulator [unclassified Paenibacillus]MDF9840751.1 IclR family KDG regulon transcriptional repressor [Paenibacillus sp. PastF-2]MDF9847334.1 IclR family KDG regulon transcriptional repressor [Paenibacillus sp. PastM-2]MDF9854088.1 IclR family KDG regulon transcriptional repressor [Paenibacillus sp. PastF-1]MDH6479361.1 IclR family KDG regulon transcriptional repressor [Paenibacillus sp. PastH-2]MDH6506906.1 IclR family KDG regulon transcriptional re